jgi:hypothetical protein
MISGRAATDAARAGLLPRAANIMAAPENARPKPLRPSWQTAHMQAAYHTTFTNCYDKLKSLSFFKSAAVLPSGRAFRYTTRTGA